MTLKKLIRELEHIASVKGDDIPVQVCIEATYGDIRDVSIEPGLVTVMSEAVILTASLSAVNSQQER